MKRKAFTLIELLVAISIVGLLASVVLSSLNVAREKGRIASLRAQDANIYHALADSAVAVYKFDEGSGTIARDMSGNGNDLAYSSAVWPTDTPDGKGSALSFNNSSGASNASMTALPASAMTVTAWVRIGTHRNWSNIVSHTWGVDGGWLLFADITGTVLFGVMGGASQYNSGFGGTPISTGVWHFIMGVYDGSKVITYVDGVKSGGGAILAGQALNPAGLVSIGIGTIGDIDEVRIYSRAYGS